MTMATIKENWNRIAYNWEQEMRSQDHMRGRWGVFPVHHWNKGQAMPDYSQCKGTFAKSEDAYKKRNSEAFVTNMCHTVVQI